MAAMMDTKGPAGPAITVATEITVHSEEDLSRTLSRVPSVKSICHSQPGSQCTVMSPEQQLDQEDDFVLPVSRRQHPAVPRNDAFRNVVLYNTSDSGFQEMIQLLKKTPPPSNYMSTPDYFSSSEDDKWKKLKRRVLHQRRRPRRRRPPVIKLPDSAVAATTIGGYRHIAISIPIQYSHLAPLPTSQYPVYDSIEAAFQREVDSRFGVLRPSNRIVTVLNPVNEDRESVSSVSLSPKASPPTERTTATALSAPPRRPRPHSVSLLPSEEQYYGPRKVRKAAKRRSAGSTQSAPPLSSTSASASRGGKELQPYRPLSAGPSGRGKQRASAPPGTLTGGLAKRTSSPSDIKTSTITLSGSDKAAIRLTLPARTSSKRQRPTSAPVRGAADIMSRHTSTSSGDASRSGNGQSSGNGTSNGSANGHGARSSQPRGSFAESLITTGSSPRLLKAQTATAYQSIPIVVHPSGAEVESPLNLNFPPPPSGSQKPDRSIQTSPSEGSSSTSASNPEERPQSRKDRVREKKQRDIERLKAQMEQIPSSSNELLQIGESSRPIPLESPTLGKFGEVETPPVERKKKEKETELKPFSLMPTLPSYLPKILPSAILGGKGKAAEPAAPAAPTSPVPSPRLSSPASPQYKWEHGSDRTSYHRRKERQAQREEREDRRARYMAKLLSEERDVLDKLSREELLQRYEALREARIYEMERRMIKLERNRDTWAQSVPLLLETLNRVLREQQHLLRDTRRVYVDPATIDPSRSQRRRPHSVEASPSFLSLDPLEVRRTQSLQSSSESRTGRQLRRADLGDHPSGLRGGQLMDAPRHMPSPLSEELEEGEQSKDQRPGTGDDHTKNAPHDRTRRKEKLRSKLRQRNPSDSAEQDAGYFSTRSNESIPDATLTLVPIVQQLEEMARLTSAMREQETR
ncbi:hypothetical protein F5Y16DRAFT_87056 [Xylariaceae sp. FL0255]|nr:hypothetical protein F5Y16DRAFT_87056 [Xylariaceae sp. FL0255]